MAEGKQAPQEETMRTKELKEVLKEEKERKERERRIEGEVSWQREIGPRQETMRTAERLKDW